MDELLETAHAGTAKTTHQLVDCPAIQMPSWKVPHQTTVCAVMATTRMAQSTTVSHVMLSE
jgi:hypothetical protein